MNKKGFTVVELTVSFSLVSIIAIMLFNLIFSLKELYVSGDIKTSLLNKQAIMDKKIYEDLNSRNLNSITACGVSCLTFHYADGDATLLIDVGANTITYDNYTMKLNNGTEIGQVSFNTFSYETVSNNKDNASFHLDIPVKTTLLDDDFGIHIVKTYKTSEINVNNNLAFNDATIIANGVEVELTKIANNEDWTISLGENNVASFDTEFTENNNVIFAHIFHQEQGTYYDDYNEFLKTKTANKRSTLKSLEAFRSNSRVINIKNVLKESLDGDKDKDKKRIEDEFAKGYFELILDYPGYSDGAFNNYIRWIQTSNFANNKLLTNGLEIDNSFDSPSWKNGLVYSNSNESYVTGSNNADLFAIGMKKLSDDTGYSIKNPDNTDASSVDIWVRANDYINKYGLAKLIFE